MVSVSFFFCAQVITYTIHGRHSCKVLAYSCKVHVHLRALMYVTMRSFRGPLANNAECKQFVDAFLAQAVRPMTSYFQITGHNRARQRDKYGHLLEDLAALQEEVGILYLHFLLLYILTTNFSFIRYTIVDIHLNFLCFNIVLCVG